MGKESPITESEGLFLHDRTVFFAFIFKNNVMPKRVKEGRNQPY